MGSPSSRREPAQGDDRRRDGDFGWRVRWWKNGNIETTSCGGVQDRGGSKEGGSREYPDRLLKARPVRTDRIERTRITAMAHVRLVSGGQMEVPDDARLTDRGIEWLDEDGVHHVVPWTAVVEFIGPPPTPPTPMVEKM